MKVKSLKCPECGANLEIEDNRTSCYCQYCGCKIILDDEKHEYTINKNININKTTTHTKRYINDAAVIREKRKTKEGKGKFIAGILVVLAVVAYFIYFFGYYSNAAEKKSIAEEEQLQIVVEEILEDIENGNYDEAYVKANSLHYTSGWSSEIEEKWDDTREALLDKIEQAEKGSSGKKPFFDWFK